MNHSPQKCSTTTAKGTPCQAWAIRGSDPPLCSPHSGLARGKKGNQNAVKHGYYRQYVDSSAAQSLHEDAADGDLDQETALLRLYINRLTTYMNDPDLTYDQFKSAGPLLVSAIRALAYIKKQLPPRDTIDWDATLDRVGKAMDWDL